MLDTGLASTTAMAMCCSAQDVDTPSDGTETLVANLHSGKAYILGVFGANEANYGQRLYTLTVDTGQQRLNSTIQMDPVAGIASFLADSGQDRLTSPTDVNYFPISLTNAGLAATVALSRIGPDVQLFASLYRQDAQADPGHNSPAVRGPM